MKTDQFKSNSFTGLVAYLMVLLSITISYQEPALPVNLRFLSLFQTFPLYTFQLEVNYKYCFSDIDNFSYLFPVIFGINMGNSLESEKEQKISTVDAF